MNCITLITTELDKAVPSAVASSLFVLALLAMNILVLGGTQSGKTYGQIERLSGKRGVAVLDPHTAMRAVWKAAGRGWLKKGDT